MSRDQRFVQNRNAGRKTSVFIREVPIPPSSSHPLNPLLEQPKRETDSAWANQNSCSGGVPQGGARSRAIMVSQHPPAVVSVLNLCCHTAVQAFETSQPTCQAAVQETGLPCSAPTLPCSDFCLAHILHDQKQKLFKVIIADACRAPLRQLCIQGCQFQHSASSAVCMAPIINSSALSNLCPRHRHLQALLHPAICPLTTTSVAADCGLADGSSAPSDGPANAANAPYDSHWSATANGELPSAPSSAEFIAC